MNSGLVIDVKDFYPTILQKNPAFEIHKKGDY